MSSTQNHRNPLKNIECCTYVVPKFRIFITSKILDMSTIQAVLRRKPNSAGLFPLAIRLTKNRKASYLYVGQYIDEKHWDKQFRRVKKSHPNSKRLNNLLLKKMSEANDKLLDSDGENKGRSAIKIKKAIVGEDNIDFFETSKVHLSSLLKRKKIGQHRTEEGRLKIFQGFLGATHLEFVDLDVPLIKKFRTFLLHERGVSPRTAVNYLILIRTIFNLAIKDYGIDAKNYPFGKDKVQIKLPESEKIGLTREEVQLLETARDLTPAQSQAVHVWLLSFYFAGIRVGDVLRLRWSDLRDGRLYYRMGKNEKLVSLAVPDKAQNILNIYAQHREDKNALVFPYLKEGELRNPQKLDTRKNTITRNLNRRLETVADKLGIEKKLSMHIARHSFGNISGDTIPIQMLQKLYRHSSITTTVNYQQNFMHKETDDALEKVIDF